MCHRVGFVIGINFKIRISLILIARFTYRNSIISSHSNDSPYSLCNGLFRHNGKGVYVASTKQVAVEICTYIQVLCTYMQVYKPREPDYTTLLYTLSIVLPLKRSMLI